jgi:hypothetical protein
MKKEEAPLYIRKEKKGRRIKYDYSDFLNPKVSCVVLRGQGVENYNSIRSTLSRWKKLNDVHGRFQFDFHQGEEYSKRCCVVWRMSMEDGKGEPGG